MSVSLLTHAVAGRWEAHVWASGRQLHLGTFGSEEAAAVAYDRAVLRLRGPGAALNFPGRNLDDDGACAGGCVRYGHGASVTYTLHVQRSVSLA